jgi:hypothetical protein
MANPETKKHGAERNRRMETTSLGPPLRCEDGFSLPASSITESVVEKFCTQCGWIECRGVMGALAFHFGHRHEKAA